MIKLPLICFQSFSCSAVVSHPTFPFFCHYVLLSRSTNLVFQIPVVCRPLGHQRCPIHHHRLYPIHHFCTLQLFPHRLLSHQPDEHHHECKLQIGKVEKISTITRLGSKSTQNCWLTSLFRSWTLYKERSQDVTNNKHLYSGMLLKQTPFGPPLCVWNMKIFQK